MRILIYAVLAYLLYRILGRFFGWFSNLKKTESCGSIDEMVQDPFCKTYIPLRDAKRKIIDGREYFFCCRECAEKFEKEMNHKVRDADQ